MFSTEIYIYHAGIFYKDKAFWLTVNDDVTVKNK